MRYATEWQALNAVNDHFCFSRYRLVNNGEMRVRLPIHPRKAPSVSSLPKESRNQRVPRQQLQLTPEKEKRRCVASLGAKKAMLVRAAAEMVEGKTEGKSEQRRHF